MPYLNANAHQSDERITLTADEVSHMLGISKRFVYELAQRGELPCRRFGKKVLFSKTAIEELMEGRVQFAKE